MGSKSNSKKYTAKASIENRVAKPAPKVNNTHFKRQEPKSKFYDVIFKNPIPYFVILIFTFLIYSQTFKFDTVSLDDNILIKDNYHLISNISNFFQTFNSDLNFRPRGSYYRPLVNIALILETQFSNSYFNIYHLSNTIVHGLVCCLLFYLFLLFNFDKLYSLLSCLIFASHPLLVNSVCWIVAMNDLLLTLFFLLSIIFLIKYLYNNNIIFLILHICSFSLSLLSKETSLVFPVIYILYILLVHRKTVFSLKNLLLIFLWAISTTIFFVLRSFVVIGNNEIQSPFKNIIYNVAVFPDIYKKVFLPFNLSPLPLYDNFNIIIGTTLLLGTFVILYFQFYRQKNNDNVNKSKSQLLSFYSIYGLFLYFIVMLPGTVTKAGNGNYFDYLENRAYLPMIGVLITLNSFSQYYLFTKFRKKISLVSGIIIIAILSFLTTDLSKIYSDPITFYNYSTKISSNSALAWNNKGLILIDLGKYNEAIKCFDKAITIKQNFAFAWNNKGSSYDKLGKFNDAIYCYNKAISLDRKYTLAWYNKGIALSNLVKFDEAISCFDEAIAIKPDYSDAWNNKGITYGKLGKLDEAIKCFDKVIALDNKYLKAWMNKGAALGGLGKFEEAIKCYDMAITINPDEANAWNNKGAALKVLGKIKEADECFRKAEMLSMKLSK